ncbi:transposase, partial [Streptomyces mirabilis]|uniref:transposase n=1 Tax=Streptomyces mirabilis TaxID=68239 RepID=UPI003686AF78
MKLAETRHASSALLPEEWAHDVPRRTAAGVPEEVGHVTKPRFALGLLERLAGWLGSVPVLVADVGHGRSVCFRLALDERGWSYIIAVEPKEIARPADAVPYLPPYQGLGSPALPRYREPPRPLHQLAEADACFETVTWRQGSKGSMTSRFAVLQVRPSGKEATRTAQEKAGGRSRWDGVLPLRTLLVEHPEEADEPTNYWTVQPARHRPGRRSGAVIVLISFGLRHLEHQPGAVRLCGPHPNNVRQVRLATQSDGLSAGPGGRGVGVLVARGTGRGDRRLEGLRADRVRR